MIKHELDFSQGVYVVGHYLYPKCPSCDTAKELLKENNLQYTFVQADKKLFGKIMSVTKQQTVPQVFINGEFIGGAEDLEIKLKGEIK